MTAIEILEEWLTAHGYDGLCNPDEECGCRIGDLIPCHSYCGYCQPGYLHGDGGIYELVIKQCNFMKCFAGMGVAGNGQCFLGGDPQDPNCPKFKDEKEALEEWRQSEDR
jgi:hypothetical protein